MTLDLLTGLFDGLKTKKIKLNIMTEIWKDIKDYEGLYQVSDMGNVRSLNYNKTGMVKNMGFDKNKTGYVRVTLHNNGKINKYSVHRLVAIAFIPNPDNKPQVNHKKGIRSDNRVSELEWNTASENDIHSFKQLGKVAHNPMANKRGSQHNRSKAIIQLTKNRSIVCTYGGASEASRETGIPQTSISACARGILTNAGGYIWEYKTN